MHTVNMKNITLNANLELLNACTRILNASTPIKLMIIRYYFVVGIFFSLESIFEQLHV